MSRAKTEQHGLIQIVRMDGELKGTVVRRACEPGEYVRVWLGARHVDISVKDGSLEVCAPDGALAVRPACRNLLYVDAVDR